MVRIFAAGDFHGDKTAAKYLAHRAVSEGADLIILNGDIVEENDAEGIVYHLVKTGKPVLMVPGNHDWFATDFLAARYNAVNLHGKSANHGGVAIFGCSGSTVAMREKEIYDMIKQTNSTINAQKKLLVTHVHPAGTVMESFSQFVKGSVGLRKAIDVTMPDIVICGHVHEAEGIEERIGKTLVINVGKKGRLIEL